MQLTIVIGIVVIVLVIAGIVLLIVRAVRSRSARSDWLGELTEIRRSSLGDDEEVTGAMEAVSIDDDADSGATDANGTDDVDQAGTDAGDSATGDDHDIDDSNSSADDVDNDDVGNDDDDRSGEEGARSVAQEPDAPAETNPDLPTEPADEDPREARSGPVAVTGAPTRTVSDAGTPFNEYEGAGFAVLRVDATDTRGLRVLVDDTATPPAAGAAPRPLVVDLPRGVLWFRAKPNVAWSGCTVRIPSGWVDATGVLLILAAETDWCYVMCLDGDVTIRFDADHERVAMRRGQIARVRAGTGDHDIVDVGVAAMESEGVVRRQRRMDGDR